MRQRQSCYVKSPSGFSLFPKPPPSSGTDNCEKLPPFISLFLRSGARLCFTMLKEPADKVKQKGKKIAARSRDKDSVLSNSADEMGMDRIVPSLRDPKYEGSIIKVLVGKIWTTKPLDKPTIRNALDKMWEPFPKVSISEISHNLYSFTFDQDSHAERAMENSPWFISDCLLSLHRWGSVKNNYEVNFNKVPFWIQLHDLPLSYFSVAPLSAIVTKIGEVLELEIPVVLGKVIRSFVRARVIVDIAKPLWTGCWVSIGVDSNLWVSFKYEGLKGMCFNCGVVGHDQALCKSPIIMSSFNKNKPKFGPSLSGSVSRPLFSIVQEMEEFQSVLPRKPALSGVTDSRAEYDRGNPKIEEVVQEDRDSGGTNKRSDLDEGYRKGKNKILLETHKVGAEAGSGGVANMEEGSWLGLVPNSRDNFEIIDLTKGFEGGFTETYLLMPNLLDNVELNQDQGPASLSYLRPVIIKYPILQVQAQETRGPVEVSDNRSELRPTYPIEDQDKRAAASQANITGLLEEGPVSEGERMDQHSILPD